ncbi:dTMP kinase [Candidatus Saccharibacteria bacterium]|nr:MAG: dTMP kinase [Candidatus Saccharibacteria bacterium]
MSQSGLYIVIEGNDGTGKTTQVDLLAEYFRGQNREVVVVEEPGSDDPDKSTPIANEIRRLIKDGSLERAPEINLALFSMARRELWHQKIKPSLSGGAVVLSTRNYYSSLAYQGRGEGVSEAEILEMTKLFTDQRYMNPDVMVILTLDHDSRRRRIAQRGELEKPDTFESRPDDFQDRVNQAYIDIAAKRNLTTIDASASIDDIQAQIQQVIENYLQK